MNTKFANILASLRANNGMAIDSHTGRELKIEAIAMIGDKDVVAMPADVAYYSLNGMFINSEGRAVVSSYAWSVMGPEIIRDTAIASAIEYNKPEYHTPGMSYHKLNNVTNIIEEENMNAFANATATAMGLSFTIDNPTPGADEMGSKLYLSADYKLMLAVTPLGNAELGMDVVESMRAGMEVVNKTGMFVVEMQGEDGQPLEAVANHPAYMAMLATVPNIIATSTMIMKTPFMAKGIGGDAYSILMLSADGTLYGLNIIAGVEEVSKELAYSFLDGTFVVEHLQDNVDAFVEHIINDPSISADIETFQKSEALQNVGQAVMRRHGESITAMVKH